MILPKVAKDLNDPNDLNPSVASDSPPKTGGQWLAHEKQLSS